jgi:uncharacterized protein YgiM (DUF1202 family)
MSFKRTVFFTVVLLYLFLMAKDGVIAVREAYLQSGPDFLAGRVSTLKSGTVVTIQSQKNGWYLVKSGSQSGYLHASVFGSGKSGLTGSGTSRTGVSDKEVALAAKGFSEENERKIKGQKGFNFADLDWVIANLVQIEEIRAFVKEGGLK